MQSTLIPGYVHERILNARTTEDLQRVTSEFLEDLGLLVVLFLSGHHAPARSPFLHEERRRSIGICCTQGVFIMLDAISWTSLR